MECSVRKSTDRMGDESRLLEMEKLQRLVQTLQEQNEQLMATVGSSTVHNGDQNQAGAVDPPRDSGIDLSASCSDEMEADILDLDRFDIADDEESWLYSTPAAKSQGDVLSWLQKDIGSLEPAARKALAVKLELLIAKRHNDALKLASMDSKRSSDNGLNAQEFDAPSDSVARILDFGDEGIFSIKPSFEAENILSPETAPSCIINRRTTFKVDKKTALEAAAAAAAAANTTVGNTATYSRPKKTTAKESPLSTASNGPRQQGQTPAPAPSLTISEDTVGIFSSAGASPGRKLVFDAIHPELNPNMHDIQLLASMQEEELRRCLQNLQQMNRRRRTSSGKEGEASPSSQQPNNLSGNAIAPAVPVITAKSSDRYATYTKPKHQMTAAPNGITNAADFPPSGKPGFVNGRKVSSSAAPQQYQVIASNDPAIAAQKGAGLQKSLPNLSGSKSEFNLPMPSFPVDTSSEKGSYGDIPSALNPPGRGQATTSSTPRLVGSGSRLPTPARSRLPTPAKSGIPVARVGQSLPVPVSHSRQRTKSPALKQPPIANTSKSFSPNESWKEGCF